ncbi:MAG TPA: tyrosine-type recombinase/integrase, partial [Paenibacillus sp.]
SRILKRAGLPSLPIHKLRHTYVVLMMEAEANMKFIQEQLGHESVKITTEVYAHISKKIETKNMEKFENYAKDIS